MAIKIESFEVKSLLAYSSAKHAQALKQYQLHTFEHVWDHPVDWFEAPNERRGGWSGVGRLQLESGSGARLCLFVKKQQNHGRLTLRHPIQGEPTFRREYKRLQYLRDHGFKAPEVVFYGEKVVDGKSRAILVTEELHGYQPLDHLTDACFSKHDMSRRNKRQLLARIAQSLRKFHELGLVHRALYPKHIFVKNTADQTQVALIDLEKARFSPFFWHRAYFDLAALNRHAEHWSRSDRLYFFLRYFGLARLGKLGKWFCRQLMKRSKR